MQLPTVFHMTRTGHHRIGRWRPGPGYPCRELPIGSITAYEIGSGIRYRVRWRDDACVGAMISRSRLRRRAFAPSGRPSSTWHTPLSRDRTVRTPTRVKLVSPWGRSASIGCGTRSTRSKRHRSATLQWQTGRRSRLHRLGGQAPAAREDPAGNELMVHDRPEHRGRRASDAP